MHILIDVHINARHDDMTQNSSFPSQEYQWRDSLSTLCFLNCLSSFLCYFRFIFLNWLFLPDFFGCSHLGKGSKSEKKYLIPCVIVIYSVLLLSSILSDIMMIIMFQISILSRIWSQLCEIVNNKKETFAWNLSVKH